MHWKMNQLNYKQRFVDTFTLPGPHNQVIFFIQGLERRKTFECQYSARLLTYQSTYCQAAAQPACLGDQALLENSCYMHTHTKEQSNNQNI